MFENLLNYYERLKILSCISIINFIDIIEALLILFKDRVYASSIITMINRTLHNFLQIPPFEHSVVQNVQHFSPFESSFLPRTQYQVQDDLCNIFHLVS